MKKSRDDVLVGVVLALAFVVVIVGSLWLARGGLSKGYPLYANFSWGAGLKTGAPVWVSGADVGYVAGVQFRPDGTLLTELRITSDQPIPKGSPATVVPNGLFGDVAVNFTPGQSSERYGSGETVVPGKSAPGIAALTGKADSITTSINVLTTELNKELVTGGGIADLRQTLAGTNKLMAQTNSLMAQLSTIATEQSRQLSLTMESLRRTTSALDSAKIDSTLVNLRAASANVTGLTSTLDSTTRALNKLVTGLEGGQGTAGKLLKDEALYNDVRHLMTRVDSILIDLQKNPRKYLKFSVF